MAESNWDKIQKKKPQDTTRYRDVYDDQQLDRSVIEEGGKKTGWVVLSAVFSVLIAVAAYFLVSIIMWLMVAIPSGFASSENTAQGEAVISSVVKKDKNNVSRLYYYLDENGDKKPDDGKYYEEQADAIVAYEKMHPVKETKTEKATSNDTSFGYAMLPNLWNILISLAIGTLSYSIIYQKSMRNYAAQQMLSNTSDINQYQNDQHIALPEEVQRKFDWFPDVGAHSAVSVSSMISHVAIQNKGLGTFNVAKRVDKDVVDSDGNVVSYKGEICCDKDGNPIMSEKPMIDTAFMEALFDASGLPKDKQLRKYYDTTKIPYNPDGSDRDKLGKFKTVADLINADWELPVYEPQRPAGAYLVDTAPVNTIKFCV